MSYRGREKPLDMAHANSIGDHVRVLRPASVVSRDNKGFLRAIGFIFGSWIVLVHFAERTYVRWTINRCQWKKWEPSTGTVTPHRLVLIADPQLVDGNSYPDRPDMLNYYVKKISDNYLFRNYKTIQYYIDPDTMVFLGDLFDGGREWNDELWFQEYKRFNDIFPSQPNRRTIQSIPGNHDIGFEVIDVNKQKRFEAFFGANNDIIELGNHTIVLLDSISLSSEFPDIKQSSQKFLDSLGTRMNPNYPRVLMTHVPLYRDNINQVCGPHRESSRPFPVQKGKQYQTVISKELTTTVLETVHPSIVFAGDDHDYCEISHVLEDGSSATEITVKAVSMTAGISRPAVQMLSLHNPVDTQGNSLNAGPSYTTEMCYLPNPFFGITLYVILYIFCIGVLGVNFLKPELITRVSRLVADKFESDKLPVFNSAKEMAAKKSLKKSSKNFLISVLVLTMYVYMVIGFYYRNV